MEKLTAKHMTSEELIKIIHSVLKDRDNLEHFVIEYAGWLLSESVNTKVQTLNSWECAYRGGISDGIGIAMDKFYELKRKSYNAT